VAGATDPVRPRPGRDEPEGDVEDYRGRGLGLPRTGAGSVASLGRRLVAYAVDSITSALIAALFIQDLYDSRRGVLTLVVLVLQYLVLGSLTGQTMGMRLLGLRIMRVSAPGALPGLVPLAVRTALLALLLPAVVTDRDGRGMHDRAAGTVVVRVR
jgi:uncharacterized RDD family membrane protein YckC